MAEGEATERPPGCPPQMSISQVEEEAPLLSAEAVGTLRDPLRLPAESKPLASLMEVGRAGGRAGRGLSHMGFGLRGSWPHAAVPSLCCFLGHHPLVLSTDRPRLCAGLTEAVALLPGSRVLPSSPGILCPLALPRLLRAVHLAQAGGTQLCPCALLSPHYAWSRG